MWWGHQEEMVQGNISLRVNREANEIWKGLMKPSSTPS